MGIADKTACLPDPLVPLDTKERVRQATGQRSSKPSARSNGAIKRYNAENISQPSASHLNGPSCNENVVKSESSADGGGSRDTRSTSIDRFSDVSRHSNSSRGYLVRLAFLSFQPIRF